MNVLLIKAICLTGFFSISILDAETTKSGSPDHRDESGVLTHGTIFDISNDQIIVLSPGSLEPIRYSHGEGTVYVDENGNSILLEVVKSGVAVTVFYSQEEEQRMANRVIVGETPSRAEVLINR